ncbi:MAG: tetratricopeptide repeat protein [Aggregatilineales bacterium]
MTDGLRIRRDHSALSDGTMFGRKRRGINRWLLGAWVLGIIGVGLVIWKFDKVQPVALAMIGQAPTATPSDVTYAQRGYAAFLNGQLEIAVENYCWASHGIPVEPTANTPYPYPRCKLPANGSNEALSIDVNIGYELVRAMIYRGYDDRRGNTYFQNADEWAKLLTAAAPKNERAHAILAFALTNDNQAEQGVPEGLTAVSLNPNDSEAHAYLSMAYYSASRYQDSVTEGEAAVALDKQSQSVDAHIADAQALFVTGQFDAAQNEYEASTKINPRLTFPYFDLAAFFLYRQQQEAAIAEYEQVLALDNKNVKALTRKCAAYFNIGETDKALSSCLTVYGLDPFYTEGIKWLGQVYYNRRDYEDAIKYLGICRTQEIAATKIAPVDRLSECWYLAGLAQYLLGHCDQAYPLFNEVLSFTDNTQAIQLTRKGIAGCAAVNPGTPTPTPIPIPPTKLPPILS